jgi:hypothetical protein
MAESVTRSVAGVDRGAFQPLMAAGACWLSASDGAVTNSTLDRLLSDLFPDQILRGFVPKFLRFQSNVNAEASEGNSEDASLLQDALLEAGAALRKIVVAKREGVDFPEDEDFEADPVFRRASELFDKLRREVEASPAQEWSKCPRCGLVGGLESWFGMRIMDGKRVRQSWCRICRSLRPAESGKDGRLRIE